MKVSVFEIAKRLVKWDKKEDIYVNGIDNLYPERVDRVLNNSVTAKMSLDILIQNLIGNGFGDMDNFKINNEQSLIDFATDLSDDIAKNRGVYVHFDFNLNFEPVNPTILPFEKCRIGKKDSSEYNGKILFKKDWSDSKEKAIVFDVYNKDPEIVKAQVEKSGSIKKYKGQVLFYNMDRNYYYPLSRIDAVLNDCDSEAQAAVYKNMILRKGFFGKQIIVTPPLISNNLPETIYDELGVMKRNPEYSKKLSEAQAVKETIESFIGSENAGGAMMIESPDFINGIDNIFKIITIDSKLDDKMFEYTESSVSKNILMAFNNLPVSLVKSPDSAMFGNSGEAINEAKKLYWQNCSKDRNIVETLVNKIYQTTPNYKEGEYLTIQSMFESDEIVTGADDKKLEAQAQLKGSVGGVQALLQIQQSVSQGLTDLESAVVIISEIFGISEDLARKMLGTPKTTNLTTT